MKVLYILMRTDMPSMNAGRAMAQASHATNQLMHRFGASKEVKEWQKETPYGFGTAIVLGCDLAQLNQVVTAAQQNNFLAQAVEDPEYGRRIPTELVHLLDEKHEVSPRVADGATTTIYTREVTCGFVFGEKEDLKPVLNGLKLHP